MPSARTILAHKRVNLAGAQIKLHRFQRMNAGKPFFDAFHFNQVRHADGPPKPVRVLDRTATVNQNRLACHETAVV